MKWTACLLAACVAATAGAADPVSTATVGMSARLDDLVIPGPPLEAKPIAGRETALVVRVVRTDPHGTAHRYTLEWYGLDPGEYDLRDALRRTDGQPLGADVPRLAVRVEPIRPPGQVEPNALPATATPAMGGYFGWVSAFSAAWLLGLVALVASFFLPRRRVRVAAPPRVVSLAERLRPLISGAVAGALAVPEMAALERGLLALWRKRLGLESADPEVALRTMQSHPDAGPLLNQLEAWLHRPRTDEVVDVAALLAPYRSIRADELEAPAPAELAVPRG